jgi:hypothetical protein
MRKAMMDTFLDPDFVTEANKRGLGVNSPRGGDELSGLLDRVYNKTPSHILARLRKLTNP